MKGWSTSRGYAAVTTRPAQKVRNHQQRFEQDTDVLGTRVAMGLSLENDWGGPAAAGQIFFRCDRWDVV